VSLTVGEYVIESRRRHLSAPVCSARQSLERVACHRLMTSRDPVRITQAHVKSLTLPLWIMVCHSDDREHTKTPVCRYPVLDRIAVAGPTRTNKPSEGTLAGHSGRTVRTSASHCCSIPRNRGCLEYGEPTVEKDDSRLLPGGSEPVLICNAYHEFDQPERMLGCSFWRASQKNN